MRTLITNARLIDPDVGTEARGALLIEAGRIAFVGEGAPGADTVIDASLPDGTGFVFDEFSENALGTALGRALDLHTRPAEWNEMVQRAMAQDFSWAERADEYVALYRSLE